VPICTSVATMSDVKTRQEGKAVMRKRLKTPWAAPPLSSTSDVVSLSAIRAGGRGVVVGLSGGRGLLGRMTALGFTPGAEVTVVQNFGQGPLIARVRGTRIALGRGEASKIHVRR
jgi:ferrous iron transport protein A